MPKVTYTSNRKNVNKEMARLFDLTLTGAGEIVSTAARLLVPVDTGRLRNSIEYQVALQDQEVIIGSPVEYAPHQELGTSKMKAQPYLKPGMLKSAPAINAMAKKVFRGGFK